MREIDDVTHLLRFNSTREAVHAREEINDMVHRDAKFLEHRSGGCAINHCAYDDACAGCARAGHLRRCVEFGSHLHSGQ